GTSAGPRPCACRPASWSAPWPRGATRAAPAGREDVEDVQPGLGAEAWGETGMSARARRISCVFQRDRRVPTYPQALVRRSIAHGDLEQVPAVHHGHERAARDGGVARGDAADARPTDRNGNTVERERITWDV